MAMLPAAVIDTEPVRLAPVLALIVTSPFVDLSVRTAVLVVAIVGILATRVE